MHKLHTFYLTSSRTIHKYVFHFCIRRASKYTNGNDIITVIVPIENNEISEKSRNKSEYRMNVTLKFKSRRN